MVVINPDILSLLRIFIPPFFLFISTIMFLFAYGKIKLRFIQFSIFSSFSLFLWAIGSSLGFYQNKLFSLQNRLRLGSISLVFLVTGYTLFVIGVKTRWDASSIIAVASTGSIIGLLAHGAFMEDPQIMAFRTNNDILYVTNISLILVISGLLLGGVVVLSVREYSSEILKRSMLLKTFKQKISFLISMIVIGAGIFAYLFGIILSALEQSPFWFYITIYGGIIFSLGYFYLSVALYISPIIFLRFETSAALLVEQKILSAAILTLDYEGPTARFYRGYEFVQFPEQTLGKLAIGYMTMIAQGESFPEGVYILPFPENKNYESLVVSRLIADSEQKDERFKGRTYVLFVITYPKALTNLFNKRKAAEQALDAVIKEIDELKLIDENVLDKFLELFVNKVFTTEEIMNLEK